jgi:hypothetical protein
MSASGCCLSGFVRLTGKNGNWSDGKREPTASRQAREQGCLHGGAATLIETAKLNGVDPQAWLTDTLARIADHPYRRAAALALRCIRSVIGKPVTTIEPIHRTVTLLSEGAWEVL